jgi:hypothetical protein
MQLSNPKDAAGDSKGMIAWRTRSRIDFRGHGLCGDKV